MDILKTLMGLLTPQLISQIGGAIGIRPELVTKALAAAGPAILGGMISKGSTENGAGALLDLLKGQKIDAALLEKAGDIFSDGPTQELAKNAGGAIMGALFGDKFNRVADLVAGHAGAPNDAIGKLLGLAAPLIAGVVMKGAPAGGFTPASLLSLLVSQKAAVAAVAPPAVMGFLDQMPGLSGFAPVAKVAPAAPVAAAEPEPERKSGVWLPWALLAGLTALVVFGPRTCASMSNKPVAPVTSAAVTAPAALPPVTDAKEKVTGESKAETAVVAAPAAEPATPSPATPSVATPSPATTAVAAQASVDTLQFARGTLGARVLSFMKSSAQGSRTFAHRGLRFAKSSDALSPERAATLKDIAAVLAAYPDAKVTFVGHTDSSGPRGHNMALSQARAKAVADALVAAGVSADRVSSRGAGEARPVARNTTVKGRRANRRVELVVTKP